MVARQSGVEKRYRRMRLDVLGLRVNGEDYVTGGAVGGYVTTGNRWYVDSVTGADTNVGNLIDGAFATIGAAITAASANQGDIIYLLQNHAETITGAAGIALTKAGVSVVGLGVGEQRPRFLMDAGTTVTCAITAADVRIENVIFAAGHADIVACITTTKADTVIVDCEFVQNTTSENFLTEIKATGGTNNDNDGLTVIGNRAISVETSALEFIEITSDVKRARIEHNYVSKKGSAVGYLVLTATGKDLQDYSIKNNDIVGAAAAVDIVASNDTGSANWGVAANNTVGRIGNPNNAFFPMLGYRVTKVGDVSTSTDALFTVTGKCLINLIVGECTSVIATTTSLQLYTSTNSIILHASTDIVTDVAGTLYIVTGDYDDVLNGAQVPNADIAMVKTGTTAPYMVNDDAIYQVVNGAGTGLIQWDLWYIPLETGAAITSAA